MSIRIERLSQAIQEMAIEKIIWFSREFDNDFGIISVYEVVVSTDYSYADIFVGSQNNEKELPHFLAPIGDLLKKSIGKDLWIRKTPYIRFRLQKHKRSVDNTLKILHEIEQTYDLHKEDSN